MKISSFCLERKKKPANPKITLPLNKDGIMYISLKTFSNMLLQVNNDEVCKYKLRFRRGKSNRFEFAILSHGARIKKLRNKLL